MTFASVREIREFAMTEKMRQLLDATEMFVIGDTLYFYSTKIGTVECPYIHDDPYTTIAGLMRRLIDTDRFRESAVREFARRFADLWMLEEEARTTWQQSTTITLGGKQP